VRFIKAVKIFDGQRFLDQETVLVYEENGRISEIKNEKDVPSDKIQHYDGTLTPGFVNAHCHLELSHLKSLIPKGKGFCDFAIDLMDKRNKFNSAQISEAMREAEKEMLQNGIVAVGDISNNEVSISVKREKKLYYHTFVELIGLHPDMAKSIFEKGKQLTRQIGDHGLDCSLAPHAPFSVSNELIELISAENTKHHLPLSIHNQESVEEHLFFMGEKSKVHALYKHLGISIDFFAPPLTSSLRNYLPLLKGKNNILVHNTFTSPDDVQAGRKKNVFWCFCPGANLYIENRLPHFDHFMEEPSQICIGTDSLASNERLDVLAELNILSENLKHPSDEQLLSMLCLNGARALAIDSTFGRLEAGKSPGLNLLKKSGSKFELIKKLF
jgi:cytosine/adenosine deaminase-related metal-dependent hydrolase